jgi:hypothetical protein
MRLLNKGLPMLFEYVFAGVTTVLSHELKEMNDAQEMAEQAALITKIQYALDTLDFKAITVSDWEQIERALELIEPTSKDEFLEDAQKCLDEVRAIQSFCAVVLRDLQRQKEVFKEPKFLGEPLQ